MRQRLFITLGMASLAMATFGMKKPKAAIKPLNAATVQQPSYTEWHDLQVNAINRFPLHTNFFTYSPEDMVYEEGGKLVSRDLAQVNKTMSKNYLSLEGTWKFNWVENADQRPTDFYKVDLDDSNWKPIIVPGNWEMYGYGVPEYVNVGFGWRGHFDEQPPAVPTKDNHVGSYRRIINIPENWDGKQVVAHFGSVTSNIYLYVNGKFAGYAEDSKVAAEFDITPYLKKGKNLIAFQTFRWCDGSWDEDQDFWRLSGVARECYLFARDAKLQLEDVRVTPDLVNNYKDGVLHISTKVKGTGKLNFILFDKEGKQVATATGLAKNGTANITMNVENPHKWNAAAKKPMFAKQIMERNQHNVSIYFNHPSVVTWSLGNETVMGDNFLQAYKWVKSQDQSRPVQYEQARQGEGTDIFCPMYYPVKNCENYCKNPNSKMPLIQCEYNHTMGNSGGNLKEYWDLVRKYPIFQGGFDWDFVDQGLHRSIMIPMKVKPELLTNEQLRQIEYTYGGDYNSYDPSDNNFNCNGIVGPDRQLNPHAYEVAYQYQNIWATLKDVAKGEVNVYNENFFRDLSNYALAWSLIEDGVETQNGTIADIDVAPHQTKTFTLPYDLTKAKGKEIFLNIDFRLKKAEPLMEAGQIVAYNQLVVKAKKCDKSCAASQAETGKVKNVKTKFTDKKGEQDITVSTADLTVKVNRTTGLISEYTYQGKSFLGEGGTLKPNFWRAPTDNDMGAGFQKKFKAWKNPKLELSGITVEKNKKANTYTICANYNMPEVMGKLELIYQIMANTGAVKVTENFIATEGEKVSDLFRFGMLMQLPYEMDKSQYYGRGPIENYSDREDCMKIGIYNNDADNQYFPYIRPQESGTKGDIRWWKQTDAAGFGFMVKNCKPFYASALHFDTDELDDGDEKDQRHSFNLKKSKYTNLFLDGEHMGVGGENSWGAWPLEKYRIHYGDKTFSFAIIPLSK